MFAILLNSSGIAILQVQNNFGVSKQSAAWIDPCKDISIAVVSFLISSYITRFGYKRAMLTALGIVTIICFIIPNFASFNAVKLLFIAVGSCFALIKMSVYSTIGIITKDSHEHISFMNFIESFFMIGNLSLYFIFSSFVNNSDPLSTSWLNAYYLLGALALAAFILLLSSKLDESAAKNNEQEFSSEFRDMFKLIARPLVLSLITCLLLAVGLVLIAMPLAKSAEGKIFTSWADAPIAAFIFPLIGLFLAPIYPSVNSAILSSLPKHKHGLMSGLIIIFSALGGTTGSLLMGYIFDNDASGGQHAFYFSLIPISILIICLSIFKKIQSKQTN